MPRGASAGRGPWAKARCGVTAWGRGGLAILAGVACVLAASRGAAAATIVVTGVADVQADDGICTLREAILAANANTASGAAPGECAAGNALPAIDEIHFDIPGVGARSIAPGSPLPAITEAVVIDGYTQPGAHANTLAVGHDAILLVELDGTTAGGAGADGLVLAGRCTVRGLVINRFSRHGLLLNGVSDCVVAGNFIGVDPTGSVDLGNGGSGVMLAEGATANVIGGSTPADRNVIAGNNSPGTTSGAGVWLEDQSTADNVILGNYLGTNAAGSAAIPNDFGINAQSAAGTRIGGPTPGERNLVSGNSNTGVRISGADDTAVVGNYIGTDAAGGAPLGNGNQGLRVDNAGHCTVGGATAADGNVISANRDVGVRLAGYATVVRNNVVGLDADGAAAMPNLNGGVHVYGYTGNALRGNRIAAANGLAIDIDADGGSPPDGVTPNDPGDADTGPNELQNFPVLTSALGFVQTTEVRGTLDSTSASTFTVELFASPACHASGHGDARTVLGAADVVTDAAGDASFTVVLPVSVPPGSVITATATDDAGNTSELSACVTVQAVHPARRPLRRILRMP